MSDGTREQLFITHLWVDGVDCGVWDKSSPFVKDSATTKYRAGGQEDEESLGGSPTYTDVTLDRNYRLARDHAILPYLMGRSGKGVAVASQQPLDRDFGAFGTPVVATGVLKTVTGPAQDSTSANAAMLSVVVEVNTIAAT